MDILARRAAWLVVLAGLGAGLAGLVFGSAPDDADAAKKKQPKVLFAVVDKNGNATASYGVTDSENTSRCATTATLAADGQGGDVYASGGILADPNAVLVETFDYRGIRADRPFSLTVIC